MKIKIIKKNNEMMKERDFFMHDHTHNMANKSLNVNTTFVYIKSCNFCYQSFSLKNIVSGAQEKIKNKTIFRKLKTNMTKYKNRP